MFRGHFFEFIALIVLSAALLLLCPAADAFDVTVVKSADIKPYDEAVEGFKSSCGCSVEEISVAGGDHPDVLRELLRTDPDAVFAVGLDAMEHLQQVRSLPIVYTMVPYPAHAVQGRKNISGVSMYITPQAYFDALEAVMPGARRIGLVYNPRTTDAFVAEVAQLARPKGFEIVMKAAHTPNEVPGLIDSMKHRIDVFWMLPDATVVNSVAVDYMLLFSFQNRVPVITFSKKYVEMGALISLSVNPYDLGVQSGELMSKLLGREGAANGTLIHARKTVLTINRKVASKMGLRIRADVLRNAEVVNR